MRQLTRAAAVAVALTAPLFLAGCGSSAPSGSGKTADDKMKDGDKMKMEGDKMKMEGERMRMGTGK